MTITYSNTNILSDKERAIFEGYHKNNKSFMDIAKSLGISHADAVERYIEAVQTLQEDYEIQKEKVAKTLATIVDIFDLHGRNHHIPFVHMDLYDPFPTYSTPFEISNHVHRTRFTVQELVNLVPHIEGRVYEQARITLFDQKRKEWANEEDYEQQISPFILQERIEKWMKTQEGKEQMEILSAEYLPRLRKKITVEHVLEKAN